MSAISLDDACSRRSRRAFASGARSATRVRLMSRSFNCSMAEVRTGPRASACWGTSVVARRGLRLATDRRANVSFPGALTVKHLMRRAIDPQETSSIDLSCPRGSAPPSFFILTGRRCSRPITTG